MKPKANHTLWVGALLLFWFPGWIDDVMGEEVLREDYASSPWNRGWSTSGATELFRWEETSASLEITWDSSKSNSYVYLPLGRTLTVTDDFSASWRMKPSEIAAGIDPEKPGTFQMAVGFVGLADALSEGFVRGSGTGSPNLLEWNFFPDTGFGDTYSSAMVASNGYFQAGMQFPFPMKVGEWHEVHLKYEAGARRVSMTVSSPSLGTLVVGPVILQSRFEGWVLDAFSFSSYSDAGQDPDYGGSILAKAWVDDVEIRVPSAPELRIEALLREGSGWKVVWNGKKGVNYRVMKSHDLRSWREIGRVQATDEGRVEMVDEANGLPDLGGGFYRVEQLP